MDQPQPHHTPNHRRALIGKIVGELALIRSTRMTFLQMMKEIPTSLYLDSNGTLKTPHLIECIDLRVQAKDEFNATKVVMME